MDKLDTTLTYKGVEPGTTYTIAVHALSTNDVLLSVCTKELTVPLSVNLLQNPSMEVNFQIPSLY